MIIPKVIWLILFVLNTITLFTTDNKALRGLAAAAFVIALLGLIDVI